MFNLANLREKLSTSYSRTRYVPEPGQPYIPRDKLVAGDTLMSTICRPMMKILAETPEIKGMSGGEQQMLTVARTLMGNPLLVLLDEPSEGVAPLIVEQMAQTIIALKKQGLSILLSEQNVHFARLVSDRVYVLEKGQIHWQGSFAELDANVDVQRTYLTV